MKHFKEFDEFYEESLNEAGVFDRSFSWLNKVGDMFKNPSTIQKSVEATITDAGNASAKNLIPNSVALKETYFIMMGDGKDPKTNFNMSLTKLAELNDGMGLFQITGTTNPDMLKALTGTNNILDLNKNSVMAIVSKESFVKGKPITVKILKNIMPGGKDYISKFLVTGIAPGMDVQKTYDKNKTI